MDWSIVSIVSAVGSYTCHGSRVWSAWDMLAVWKTRETFSLTPGHPCLHNYYFSPMAESIPAAWISDYLIDAAETYGAQHYDVPPFKKKKRVQLIEVNNL